MDLLSTDEDDFESLEDVSDSEIEADEAMSTSTTDQRKEADTIVDKCSPKEQNLNFDEAIIPTKRKRLPNGTCSIVGMYKLEVLYEHVNILKWRKGNEKLIFLQLQ